MSERALLRRPRHGCSFRPQHRRPTAAEADATAGLLHRRLGVAAGSAATGTRPLTVDDLRASLRPPTERGQRHEAAGGLHLSPVEQDALSGYLDRLEALLDAARPARDPCRPLPLPPFFAPPRESLQRVLGRVASR